MPELTAQQTAEAERNGMSAQELQDYIAERDKAAGNLVGGNVPTAFQRARPAIRHESAIRFKPYNWGKT